MQPQCFRSDIFEQYEFEQVDTCLCGSAHLQMIASSDRDGYPFGSYLCRDCGLILTHPRLNKESMRAFYRRHYTDLFYKKDKLLFHNPFFYVNYCPYQGFYIYKFLKNYLPPKKQITVAEIGCGCGLNLYQITLSAQKDNISVHTIGVDYNPTHIATAKNYFGLNEGIIGGISELADAKTKIDVIICSHIIEHLPDPYTFLKILNKLVKPTSLVYVEVPGILDLKNRRMYCYGRYYYHFPHVYCYCLQTLTEVFNKSGFELVKGTEYIQSVFSLSNFSTPVQLTSVYEKVQFYLTELESPSYNYLSKAVQLENSGNIKEGIRLAQKALKYAPINAEVLYRLSNLYLKSREWGKAIKYGNLALKFGVHSRYETMMILYEAYTLERKTKNAKNIFQKCIQLEPWNNGIRYLKARLLRQTCRYLEALETLKNINEIYELDAKYIEGLILMDLGRYREADHIFSTLVDIYPECACASIQQGLARKRLGYYKKSLMAFRTALKTLPNDTNIQLQIAVVLKEMGEVDKALTLIESILKKSDDFQILKTYGGILVAAGNYSKAHDLFNSLYFQYPNKSSILLNICDVQRLMKKYNLAFKTIEKLEAITSGVEGIWLAKAKLYEAIAQYQAAYEFYMIEYNRFGNKMAQNRATQIKNNWL